MSKNLDELLKEINKKHGEGSIFRMGSKDRADIPVIPTGILSLDAALGIGGIPLGKYVEIFSQSGGGKSSTCVSIAAQAQKLGYNVAYIDSEQACSLDYFAKMGVNVDDLFFSQPDNAETAFDIVEHLIDSEEFRLIIVDSVDALQTQREIDGDLGDSDIGVKAKLMSKVCRRFKSKAAKNNCTLAFISQLRDLIGAVGYQETTITTGGKALKFYSDVRIELKRIGQIKAGDDIVGHKTQAKVVKNKLAPPMKTAIFEVYYTDYNTLYSELVDLGTEAKFIEKAGAGWMTYNGFKVQGKEKFKQYLMENPEVMSELETKVKGWLGL